MEQLALSHPEISFKYIQNRQVKLHTSGHYSTRDVIFQVYGKDIAKGLLEIQYENEFMKISGFAGKPEISRGNRSFENYYINGRYVKNNIITKAIEDAYKGFLMQHKFPFVSLHMEMDGNDLDVNVHPAKREVRFARGTEVYDAVFDTIRRALTRKEMIPSVSFGKEEKEKQEKQIVKPGDIPEPFEKKRREQETAFTKEEELLFSGTLRENQQKIMDIPKQEPMKEKIVKQPLKPEPPKEESPSQMNLFEERLLAPESRIHHQLIGQLFDTYWLVQFGEDFYIIDQHAAHEKVFYERLVKQFENQTVESQYVSPPLIVTLNLQEEALLKANETYFREFGFEIEPFGGREYCISAVPANLYGIAEEELFLDMLDHLAADGEKQALSLFTSRLATMACKAAVKGNHKMSVREADELIDELLKLENPYHCPHGRPIIISMSKTELEKKFKRIV